MQIRTTLSFILALTFCTLCFSQNKAKLAAPFDAKTADAFFSASPNLEQSAKNFAKDAENFYSQGKLEEASCAYFASEFFKFTNTYLSNAPKELKIFLLSNPYLLDEFFSILAKEDNLTNVANIIEKIWKSDSDGFKKMPTVALAIAIVFDTPAPASWPHGQVSETILPRKFPEPDVAFASWKGYREKGRLLLPIEKLSIEEAKYLVASVSSDDDKQYAQKSISANASNIGKLYMSINYDHARLNRKQFDWIGDDYNLKTIKENGGICTDQSYYTTEVAKARGLPAFIFSGAGSDGFHAWAAIMRKPNDWDFGIGRYEDARFVTGKTLDPQTWKEASDHSLEAMREGFRRGKKFRENEIHTIFAKKYFEACDYANAEKCAMKAIASDKRNFATWLLLEESLRKSNAPHKKLVLTLEAAVKSFFKYHDLDAHFRQKLMDEYINIGNKNAARKLSTSIINKTKSARPDIAMKFARAELEADIATGEAEKLMSSYKRLATVFKSDAAIAINSLTVPIVNALLKAEKYKETEGIMKLTRQIFLKGDKDVSLTESIESIERQLEQIRKKNS